MKTYYINCIKKSFLYICISVLILIGAATPILAQPKSSLTPTKQTRVPYQHFTLENGLEVMLIPNNRAPVVYHALWYKVGSADSPAQQSGIAHFLEHLMFKGSQKFPKDTYKRIVNDVGGMQNANTSWDRTLFFVTVAKEYLPIVMEMEADRMHNLVFNKESLEKEKEVVLQERRSVADSQPMELLSEAAQTSFFWEHPYGKPVIGFEKDILNYTLENAQKFYKTWYHPNNAILIIAGDFDVKSIKPLVEQYYGSIPKGNLPERIRPNEPDHHGVTAKIESRSPQLGSSFQKMYRAPNHTTSMRVEAALTLLQDILGDSTFGRLNTSLVENQKMAHSISTAYIGHFYDPFVFNISASPVNASDLQQLESSVEAEIRRLIAEGVSESEVEKAKEQWKFSTRYQLDSLNGLADYFGENLAHGYTLDEIENWLETLNKVTPQEIQEAARAVLENGPEVITYTHHVAQK